jgi:hypothetical protein
MNSSNIPGWGVKARSPLKADILTSICEPIVQKVWEPQDFTTPWAPRLITGIALHSYLSMFRVLCNIPSIVSPSSPTESLLQRCKCQGVIWLLVYFCSSTCSSLPSSPFCCCIHSIVHEKPDILSATGCCNIVLRHYRCSNT